jgi:hypothetical protein
MKLNLTADALKKQHVRKSKSLFLSAVAAIGLTATTMAQVPNYVPTNGLAAWYSFSGNAIDDSGNGNNGVVNGGIFSSDDRYGITNSSKLFDGVPLTYINCGNSTTLNITNNQALTVSAWIYFDSTTLMSNQDVIFKLKIGIL